MKGQRHIRKLNDRQTADMIKFTCQQPQMRANKIRQGLDILNYRGNEYMQQFGMRVATEMTVVSIRVCYMVLPTLIFLQYNLLTFTLFPRSMHEYFRYPLLIIMHRQLKRPLFQMVVFGILGVNAWRLELHLVLGQSSPLTVKMTCA